MCHRKKSTRVTRKYIENENTAYGNLCYLVKIMLPTITEKLQNLRVLFIKSNKWWHRQEVGCTQYNIWDTQVNRSSLIASTSLNLVLLASGQ